MAALCALLLSSTANTAEVIILGEQDEQRRPGIAQQEMLCLPADQSATFSQLFSQTDEWPWPPPAQRTLNRGFTSET